MKLRTLLLMPLVGICLAGATQESDVLRERIAVVERERLWQCHPGYGRLAQLDLEVRGLESQRQELLAQARFNCDALVRRSEAQQLWDAQRLDLRRQMEATSREFQVSTEKEMAAVHARFEGKVAEIMKKSQVPSREMAAIALTRFRLEGQKELDQRVQAEYQRRAAELARQDDLAVVQVQEEKVNLQLHDDEQSRHRLQELDERLSFEREARHEASRRELEAWVEEQRAQLDRDVAAYQARLAGELKPPAAELQALRLQERQEMQRVQELRQAEMVEVVSQLEGNARMVLERRLGELTEQHHLGGELLPRRFLTSAQVARLRQLPGLIEEARARRRREAAQLGEGIEQVVGEQAKARGVEVVLTDVRVNNGLQDLTDVCLAGVSQLKP